MKRASIIITTHQRPELLPRAVRSALDSADDVEVIVVDDASSDETRRVCQSLSGIKYVRLERNQQVAGARNIGLLNSGGACLTFLDDDDVRLPGSLERQIRQLEADSTVGLVYGQAVLRRYDTDVVDRLYPADGPERDVFWKLVTQNFIPSGTAVFRRACLYRVGILDRDVPGIDDWDLWIRISALYPVAVLDRPTIICRRATPISNQGTSNAAKIVSLSIRQFQKWMNLPRAQGGTSDMRRTAWHKFSENMVKHLLCECGRALGYRRPVLAIKDLALLPRLYPLALAQIAKDYFFRATPGSQVQ